LGGRDPLQGSLVLGKEVTAKQKEKTSHKGVVLRRTKLKLLTLKGLRLSRKNKKSTTTQYKGGQTRKKTTKIGPQTAVCT